MSVYLVNDINYFSVLQMNYRTDSNSANESIKAKNHVRHTDSNLDFSRMLDVEIQNLER